MIFSYRRLLFFLLVYALFINSNEKLDLKLTELNPPSPKKVPKILKSHGLERTDNYFWMRDDSRKNKEVIQYLKDENEYLEKWFLAGKDKRDDLFEEIISRVPQEEESVPVSFRNYEYYRRYSPDKEHPIYLRRKKKSSNEEVLLDANKLAINSKYYQLSNWSISPKENLVAFAEDKTGRRLQEIRFKDLSKKEILSDKLKGTSGDMAWSENGDFLFYISRNSKTLLPFQVYRHKIGDRQSQDILVYEESDSTFHVSVGNSRTRKFIEIDISSTNSSEVLLIDSSTPKAKPQLVKKREKDLIYSVEHDGENFLILTNWLAKNFRLMTSSFEEIGKKEFWKEIIPHRENVLLQSVLAFPGYIVTLERKDGLRRIRTLSSKGRVKHFVKFNDPSYSASFASNPEFESKEFYFGYSSLRTPDTIYSVNLKTGRKKLLKQEEVKGIFEPSRYRVKRIFIEARDGAQIPVSLVYKKETFRKGKNPLFIYGYGSYGISVDASFSSSRISLLERGFVFAIAHIRGGQELGRQWYENGKMLKKKNTFYDFIDATKGLVDRGFADSKRIYAGGGSAGGLLIGSVINIEPELYRAIVSNVPFVDVLTTMSDASIPLTTGEYDEWGNPSILKEFNYMLSYSPYDNIDEYFYPSILVTAGLWDSQVQYYEPAKYVAKLRDFTKSSNPIIMKVNLSAGHSGVSGRFESLKEIAMEYAFLIRIDEESRKNK